MREIKFRLFDEKSKEFDMFTLDDLIDSDREPYSPPVDLGKSEQFTGLKDVNGVGIYEGDVVKKDGKTCEVIFSKKAAKFCVRLPSKQWHGVVQKVYSITGVEVIGNIHENQELLKEPVLIMPLIARFLLSK